jgi:hypothetical protein
MFMQKSMLLLALLVISGIVLNAGAVVPFYENTSAIDSTTAQHQQQETATAINRGVCDTIRLPEGVVMEMRLCPAGSFRMGSPDNENGHEFDEPICTAPIPKPFYMSTVPITQGQYKAIMAKLPDGTSDYQADFPARISFSQTANELIPAIQKYAPAGWKFAMATDTQMEYATRAGTLTTWYSGEDEAEFAKTAWYSGNSGNAVHAAGTKRANAWGFKDMLGNVWQWVVKVGWYDGQLVKGGAYNTAAGGNGCRCANLMIQSVPSAFRVTMNWTQDNFVGMAQPPAIFHLDASHAGIHVDMSGKIPRLRVWGSIPTEMQMVCSDGSVVPLVPVRSTVPGVHCWLPGVHMANGLYLATAVLPDSRILRSSVSLVH